LITVIGGMGIRNIEDIGFLRWISHGSMVLMSGYG
jgi:hypothetical protein